MYAISTLLVLVAGKASWVLVDRWITSETFHDVQNANRHCTGHATMSTERRNYRLITVHTPFLAIASNQKSLSNCCMEALSHWPEMKNSGLLAGTMQYFWRAINTQCVTRVGTVFFGKILWRTSPWIEALIRKRKLFIAFGRCLPIQ